MPVFYRGAQTLESDEPTYWAYNRKDAEEYAKLRKGKVFVAHLTPKKSMIGPDATIAKQLGIYNEWIKTRTSSRKEGYKKANTLLHNAAKKAGADALIYDEQVVVLNPKIIHLIKSKSELTGEGKGKYEYPEVGLKVRDRDGDEWVVTERYTKPFSGFKVFSKEKNLELRCLDWDWGGYTVIGRVKVPKSKPRKEIGVLKARSAKQSDHAIAIDRSLLAKNVVSVDDPRWLKRPNRFDVRGIDTPSSSRIVPGVVYADKGSRRLSRRKHRGWRRIKLT